MTGTDTPERGPLHVEVDGYEGPLEGLIGAAQRGEVDLATLSLDQITRELESRLVVDGQADPALVAELLSSASRLVQLKANRLLPGADEPVSEEEGPSLDEGLGERLELYRLYRDAAERLMQWHREDRLSFPGLPLDLGEIEPELELDLGDLVEAFQRALRRLPELSPMELVQPAYTVEEKVVELEASLRARGGKLSFGEVFAGARDRLEAVALFLALLEMLKRRLLNVRQRSVGGEIEVSLR